MPAKPAPTITASKCASDAPEPTDDEAPSSILRFPLDPVQIPVRGRHACHIGLPGANLARLSILIDHEADRSKCCHIVRLQSELFPTILKFITKT